MKADLIKYISKINEKPSVQGKLLEQFISHGASTIPEMSKAIGVSLPTTTSALNELIKEGLAREIGKKDNSSGRIPMVYDLVPTAGYFIGVNPEDELPGTCSKRLRRQSDYRKNKSALRI